MQDLVIDHVTARRYIPEEQTFFAKVQSQEILKQPVRTKTEDGADTHSRLRPGENEGVGQEMSNDFRIMPALAGELKRRATRFSQAQQKVCEIAQENLRCFPG